MYIKRLTCLFLFIVFTIIFTLSPVSAKANKISDNYTVLQIESGDERPANSKGDIDGDGKVTSIDYLLVKRIFYNTYTANDKQLFAADINKDGFVTAIDYLLIKRHFFQTYNITPTVLYEQIILSEQQTAKIKTDYIEYLKANYGEEHFSSLTPEDILIKKFFGPYDGGYALFISHKDVCFLDEIITEDIAGYKFLYFNRQTLTFYKDSSFYSLKNAYESNIISKDKVYDLFWNFRTTH